MVKKGAEQTESPSGEVQTSQALLPSGRYQAALVQKDENDSPKYSSEKSDYDSVDDIDHTGHSADSEARAARSCCGAWRSGFVHHGKSEANRPIIDKHIPHFESRPALICSSATPPSNSDGEFYRYPMTIRFIQ
jgi:hypothetical protein